MDYKEKYEMALERAKEKYPACYSPALLEYIFPELKESEDEKIRKEIIEFLHLPHQQFVGKRNHEEWIEWLEKQGDKDSQVKLPTFTFDDILALQCCMETVKKVQNDKDLYEKLNDLHGRIYDAYYLEKQGDTNETINKDEFAQGVLKGAAINLITWIDYNAAEGNMCLSNMECKDVEDALVSGDWNKIYAYIKKKLEKQGEQKPANSYCQENCKGFQETGKCFADGDCKAKREAEFTDKVEQRSINEIEIPFGAKDSELQEATYYIPKGFHAEIDDDKVVIKKGEKPTAWSKKDEKMFEYALNMIEWYSGKNEDKSRFVSDWLKSIKQRIGG